MNKPWKELTPKERSDHMLAAKKAKKSGTGGRVAEGAPPLRARTKSPVGSNPTPSAIIVAKSTRSRPAKAQGFGVGWTQEQRDEVLHRINSTPKER